MLYQREGSHERGFSKGIVNEKLATDMFNKLSNDIRAYIKKRWPIK